MAKVTLNMDSASQWVSKMGRLFLADEYVRHEVGTEYPKFASTTKSPAGGQERAT
jgi:hypothetical protein